MAKVLREQASRSLKLSIPLCKWLFSDFTAPRPLTKSRGERSLKTVNTTPRTGQPLILAYLITVSNSSLLLQVLISAA
jgi:hypothetical protein